MSIKPLWVVENYTRDKTFSELTDAIKAEGLSLIEIKEDYRRNMFSHLPKDGVAIFSGSMNMMIILEEDFPATWTGLKVPTWQSYLCSRYYSYYGELLFNDKYLLLSIREFKRNKFSIYGQLGKEATVFVRPDSGQKVFAAQLVDIIDFDEFYRNHEHIEHFLVSVSSPKNIGWEGRFVCCGQEIIAHSTYKFQGQLSIIPSVPQGAVELCREALKRGYSPDGVFCLDVCSTPDMKEFYVLEINAFSSSGLYACDKRKIVNRVSELATTNLKL